MKKIVSLIMSIVMVIGIFCMPTSVNAKNSAINQEKLYVYSFNKELKAYVEFFREKYPEYEDLIVFKDSNCGSGDDEYLNLVKSSSKNKNGTAGVYAIEEANVKEIFESSSFYNLEDIGFTNDDFSKAYGYTKQVASINGKIKGATWQCCVGGFVYNRKIARKVFATDDPVKIQKLVKNWNTFNKTAEKLNKKGYYILSGLDDVGRALADNYSSATYKNNKPLINKEIKQYVNEMIILKNKNYTKNTIQFTDEWFENMNSADSDVFGFFGPSWFLGFTMNDVRVEQLNGGFNLCEGPADFNWGGTYLGVSKNCLNPGLAELFIKTICIDKDSMYELAISQQSFPNNTDVVKKLRKTKKLIYNKIKVQNAFTIFDSRARKLNKKYATKYDEKILKSLNDTINEYITSGKKIKYDDFIDEYKKKFNNL